MNETPGEELQQVTHNHPQLDGRVVLPFTLIPEETPWEYGHRLAVEGFAQALQEEQEAESAQGCANVLDTEVGSSVRG